MNFSYKKEIIMIVTILSRLPLDLSISIDMPLKEFTVSILMVSQHKLFQGENIINLILARESPNVVSC